MIPCNVWLLDSAEIVLSYSLQGGRIIFITEDDDPRLQYIPNKVKASILLPPYDILSDELDGNLELAQDKYYNYLSRTPEPVEFITVILAAALQNKKIGLYFGPELKDLQFPKMFLNYLYFAKGLSVGYRNTQPFIRKEFMPVILSDLYVREYITPEQYLLDMPANCDIPPFILPNLVHRFRPLFVENMDYNKYFKDMIRKMKEAGKYLYSPVIGPEVR